MPPVPGDQWDRVKQILQSALDRTPEERAAFVREACGEDHHVRTEVESLLLAHQQAGGFAEMGVGIRDLGLDLIGREIGAYRILSLLGVGGMGRSIARATPDWAATSRSKSCRGSSPAIPIGWRVSNERHAYSPCSTILTSARFMD
jgi:hypothetical protein